MIHPTYSNFIPSLQIICRGSSQCYKVAWLSWFSQSFQYFQRLPRRNRPPCCCRRGRNARSYGHVHWRPGQLHTSFLQELGLSRPIPGYPYGKSCPHSMMALLSSLFPQKIIKVYLPWNVQHVEFMSPQHTGPKIGVVNMNKTRIGPKYWVFRIWLLDSNQFDYTINQY